MDDRQHVAEDQGISVRAMLEKMTSMERELGHLRRGVELAAKEGDKQNFELNTVLPKLYREIADATLKDFGQAISTAADVLRIASEMGPPRKEKGVNDVHAAALVRGVGLEGRWVRALSAFLL